MEKLLNLLKTLEEYEVKGIYWNDTLEEFSEFIEAFKHMEIEKVVQEAELNIYYLLLSNGTWQKISVYSLEELEELEMLAI